MSKISLDQVGQKLPDNTIEIDLVKVITQLQEDNLLIKQSYDNKLLDIELLKRDKKKLIEEIEFLNEQYGIHSKVLEEIKE